ncbi:MAG: septal ring lytic transglycosylase RlpA family protein [Coriobacteriia bacterium]|nr:septal ring lytic transglycosylase RlpA family protein [Coriobacteriia bacterium]
MNHTTTLARRLSLTLLLATLLSAACATAAFGAPSAAEVATSRQALDRALAERSAAEARAARLSKSVAAATGRLDEAMASQQAAQKRLRSHANAAYRSGQISILAMLFGSVDFADFSSRWALLTRINEDEARSVRRFKAARAKARATAKQLLALQQAHSRELRGIERQARQAKAELASDQAAYQEYQRRATPRPASSGNRDVRRPSPSVPQVAGNGAWGTGVASHYGRNFTGRGASGKRIGPDSMMVAHKTLPFGTLVEFRYKGRTAVASVEDRGPFTPGRDWDLGPGVIRILGFNGVHKVSYRIVGR